MSNQEQCFFSSDKHCVIDILKPNGRTSINNQTLNEVKLRYPDAKKMNWIDAIYALESRLVSETVTEINEDEFDEALCCLPPNQWVRNGETESFKCSEHYSGAITAVYVRVNERYFTFRDYFYIKHEVLVNKVLKSINSNKQQ